MIIVAIAGTLAAFVLFRWVRAVFGLTILVAAAWFAMIYAGWVT
jgi:hypothetical protein